MPHVQRLRSLLARLLRHRLFLLSALIGAAYLFSVGTASALPPAPGRIPNGPVYSCGTCHQSGHSSGVPLTPAHGDAMRADYFAANKTWTVALANKDSDGDGFTNGEELQDPSGAWAIGQADPGDGSFVSNPSDSNTNNNGYECDLHYRATPPAPLLLDIIGYAASANGDVTFGVTVRSPLPIDYVRYTVKKGSQTIHEFFSTSTPIRSDSWNSEAVADGSYTITAQVVELRAKPGETGRNATRTETFTVDNGSPTFGPVGETVGTPFNPCGLAEALNGIAAVSPSDIWAVGTRFIDGPGEQMLIKHWDGIRWTSVISPNASTEFNRLSAVAAASSNDVWAVGQYDPGDGVIQTLIQHWDGSVWRIVPSPNEGASNNRLAAVAALDAGSAWAVGSADDGSGGSNPLILRWSGTSWQRIANVPVPPNAYEVTLQGVAVVSANDAWAVGSYRDGGNILQKTLILRWNGTSWSIVSSPNPESFQNALNAVTVVSAGDAWAVGYASDGTGYKTLALHWNGSNWQKVNSPSPGDPNSELLGVAAVTSDDVWAVGYANEGGDGSVYRTLALHWSGSSWQAVDRPGDGDSRLNAVDTLGGTALAAGTETVSSSVTNTLVESYWGTRPPAQLPVVAISASDPSAAEDGPNSGAFTITRSGSMAAPLSVQYSVGGTATSGSDYSSLPGLVMIPAGQASTTITLVPIDDPTAEASETVVVTLSADPAYTLGASKTATNTIADDDSGQPPQHKRYLPMVRRS
jgi:hypothetical protein